MRVASSIEFWVLDRRDIFHTSFIVYDMTGFAYDVFYCTWTSEISSAIGFASENGSTWIMMVHQLLKSSSV